MVLIAIGILIVLVLIWWYVTSHPKHGDNYYMREGTPVGCPPGKELVDGMCYPTPTAGFNCDGPVCKTICPTGSQDNGDACSRIQVGSNTFSPKCLPGSQLEGEMCFEEPKPGYICSGIQCVQQCPDGFTSFGAYCKKPSYLRGDGLPAKSPSDCSSTQEFQDGVCYPKCKPGYVGAGPNCWLVCPPGWKDNGDYCYPPTYVRAPGTKPTYCEPGKELIGGICYNKCPTGTVRGQDPTQCLGGCPQGTTDTNSGCTKSMYMRPASMPDTCPGTKQLAGLMCYDACKQGYIADENYPDKCWEEVHR